jgi:hypothetical protein
LVCFSTVFRHTCVSDNVTVHIVFFRELKIRNLKSEVRKDPVDPVNLKSLPFGHNADTYRA